MLRRRFKLIKQGDTLSDLTDVDTTGATSGQVLIWNGTEWVPADITAISLFDESVQDIIGSKLLSGIGLTGTYDDAGAGTYTIDLDHLGIEDLADPNADRIMFWDDSAGYVTWLTAGTGLTLSGTTLTSDWLTVGTDTIWDAKGDLAVGTGANTASKLTVGTDGYVLTADSAQPTGLKWAAGGAGAVATDTIWDAKGDLAVGTGADTASKLTVGTDGFVLTADSTTGTGLKWAAAPGGGVATDAIWDAKGDLAVGTGADTAAKLTVGVNGYYLVADSGEATGLKWAAGPTGSVATDAIWDAKGDLAIGTADNTAAKLTVGTNGYVLTADSAEVTGVKWAAAAAGSVATDTIWDAKGDLAVGTGADTAAKLTAGTDGYYLVTDSAQSTGLKWQALPAGGTPVDVQSFTSDGTWTKSGSPLAIEVLCLGAGGGGGGGQGAAAGAIRRGGGGGGGGAFVRVLMRGSDVSSPQTVTVGTGGPGGAGGVTANGTAGTAGENSSFGAIVIAYGGGGGASGHPTSSGGGSGGGSASAGNAGTNSTGTSNLGGYPQPDTSVSPGSTGGMGGSCPATSLNYGYSAEFGGAGAGGGGQSTAGGSGGGSMYGGAGGGGGGGVNGSTPGTHTAGGTGGSVGPGSWVQAPAAGGGGTAGAGVGASGSTGVTGINGSAGSGGGGNNAGTGGAGGAGGKGAGGGGGGGGTTTGGAGGNGGDGVVIVISYY